MNWGLKIVVGLGAFMLFIIFATIYMVSKDSDTLIDENYYENSLSYNEVYDRKQNLVDDDARPLLKLENDTLSIIFKSTNNKGELSLKRPSDGSLDKVIPLFTSSNIYTLPVSTFSKGNWNLEINWESNNKSYVDNQSLYIK